MEVCLKDFLKNNNYRTIEYYEVKGLKVKKKLGKVRAIDYYTRFNLYHIDKRGRERVTYECINTESENFGKYSWSYPYRGTYFFISKKMAYDFIINKLRCQRQEINKKMMEVLKEASISIQDER